MDHYEADIQQNNSTNWTNVKFDDDDKKKKRQLSSIFLNFETSKTPGTSMSLSLSDRHIYGSDIQFWLYLLIPPILCGALIPMLDMMYLKLATLLNSWENHKTESS